MNSSSEHGAKFERAVRAIMESASGAIGDRFFDAMTIEMAKQLGANCTLIGLLEEGRSDQVRTVALSLDGQIIDNVAYSLVGTPCEAVIGEANVCCYPQNIIALFPEDEMLKDISSEAYVGIPLKDARGESIGLMAALYDKPLRDEEFVKALMQVFAARISAELERYRMDKQRRSMEERMLHSQKLESLGVLAGGIAHDFNNLLCGMLGNAEIALDKIGDNHDLKPELTAIVDASNQAAGLCRQLLAYSGHARYETKPVQLSKLCREMKSLLDISVGTKAALTWNLDDCVSLIEADSSQLQQIVFNLVMNAAEAARESGAVVILRTGEREFANDEINSRYLASIPMPGRFVFLEVKDNGEGMSEATLDRLFDPFFTTKFAGRGLGLAATLGIIQAHKGFIQVNSKEGLGSSFLVGFPVSGVPRPEPQEEFLAHTKPELSGKILVVDDDPTVRQVVSRLLVAEGYEVDVAMSGPAAIEKFSLEPSRYDLIMLDLTMPQMSGKDAFKKLREKRADIPILLMSGYSESPLTGEFLDQGTSGFVQKPMTRSSLQESLCRLLPPTE